MILSFSKIHDLILKIYPTIFTKNEVNPIVFMGQVIQESSGNTEAYSNDSNGGAYGLFQIDKKFLSEFGFSPDSNLYDPETNITVALTYLYKLFYGQMNNKSIIDLKNNLRVAMMLLCYNCGPGNYNLLYTNHIKSNYFDWNQIIQDYSTVSNWKQCLSYPVHVFYNANMYFQLPMEVYYHSYLFATPICLFEPDTLKGSNS